MSQYLDRPCRSLAQYRDELAGRLKRLPLADPERGRLALRIVEVEDELERRAAPRAAAAE